MAAFMGHAVLVTTTTTPNQEIYAYTVAGSALTILFISLGVAYTKYNATEAYLGFGRIQYDVGSGWVTQDRSPAFINTDLDNNCPMIIRPLQSGHVLDVGHKVRGICTPASVTSMRWAFSVWGNQ